MKNNKQDKLITKKIVLTGGHLFDVGTNYSQTCQENISHLWNFQNNMLIKGTIYSWLGYLLDIGSTVYCTKQNLERQVAYTI